MTSINVLLCGKTFCLNLGDENVGKTLMTHMLIQGQLTDRNTYQNTLAEESFRKQFIVDGKSTTVTIDFFYISEYQDHLVQRMNNCHVAIFVFSLTSSESYEFVVEKSLKFRNLNEKSPKPILLVGNKSDLSDQRTVSFKEAQELAKYLNTKYIECSAKNNENLDKVFIEAIHMYNQSLEKSSKDQKKAPKKGLFSSVSNAEDIESDVSQFQNF